MADETPTELLEIEAEDVEASPDVAQLLEEALRGASEAIHVGGPGVAQSVSMGSGRAAVQPAVSKSGEDREPTIPDVPVLQLRSRMFELTIPLSGGEPVLLIHADRSLDEWAAGGGEVVEARDPRAHDVTDAVALPLAPGGSDAANLVIRRLSGAGLILIGGDAATATQAALLGDIVRATMQAFFTACGGALDPAVVTAAAAAQATLATWLSQLVKVA